MADKNSIIIQPVRGTPKFRKTVNLSGSAGFLEVTDARGRVRQFNLSDSDGPYHLAYGMWGTKANGIRVSGPNEALVNRSGQAVLLIDSKPFRVADIERLHRVLGLELSETAQPPRAAPGAASLLNPPYLRWGIRAYYPAIAAWGLSFVNGLHWLIWVVPPALAVMVVCLAVARLSTPTAAETTDELRQMMPDLNEAGAAADQWLAQHRPQLDSPGEHGSESRSTNVDETRPGLPPHDQ